MIVRVVWVLLSVAVLVLVMVPPLLVASFFPTTWVVLGCLAWMFAGMVVGERVLALVP